MLKEAHYFELPSPTHINCLAKFTHLGIPKAIVAATSRIFVFETIETPSGNLRWNCTSLQSSKDGRSLEGREILSLDAFNSLSNGSPIIVYTLSEPGTPNGNIPKENEIRKFSLNICGSHCKENETLDSIFDDRQILKLDFVPFRLYHVLCESSRQIGILLSGSDHKLHLYLQNEQNLWSEYQMSLHFNELSREFKFYPLAFDVVECERARISVVACQSGHLNLLINQRHSGEIKEESISLDSPLVAVKLYHPHKLKPIKSTQSHIELILEKISTKIKNILQSTPTSSPSSLTLETTKLSQNDQESSENINLVVASGLGFAFLFRDVLRFGLSRRQILPESDTIDAVVAVDVADVNNDGYNEVMIGSYGQKVVIYHQNQSSDQMESLCTESKEDTSTSKSTEKTSIIDENSTKEKNTPQTTTTTTTTTTQTEQIENFSVLCSHQFTYPVFGFVVDDFCRDGTQCVIVSSMFGMHLLQANIIELKQKLLKRMELLHKIIELENSLTINNEKESK